jgi:hypothetical protein
VHIYALHEYRWGFDLQAMIPEQDTNYAINIFDDKLIEIGLPGVHSDIGGSYDINKFEQDNDNSLLACIALEKMIRYASENDVPLDSVHKDADRKSVSKGNKNFRNMESSYNAIRTYIENNDLRLSIGLWREHIALVDIYKHKFKNNLAATKSIGHAGASAKMRQHDIEKTIKIITEKIELSEQQLLVFFNTEQEFNKFKSNYDTLYQDYMHKSHSPFNTTFAMGKQDADENFWLWKKTVSDERPHRDIFYNPKKDFEKINSPKAWNGNSRINDPEKFRVLKSIKWEDDTRD